MRGRTTRRSTHNKSVTAHEWTQDNVSINNCGPAVTTWNLDTAGDAIQGHHEWLNDNPRPTDGSNHAYIEAQVTLDGTPLEIDVNTNHDFRRQVDPTTYAVLVGPNGGAHTVPFSIQTSSIPNGEGMVYAANVLTLEQRGFLGF